MSTWTKQLLVYGIKVDYDFYQQVEKKVEAKLGLDAYDKLNAENNEQGFGWVVDGMNGEFAVIGKIIMHGEDSGNDDLLAAESGILEIPLLPPHEERGIWWAIHESVKDFDLDTPCQYYAITMYC